MNTIGTRIEKDFPDSNKNWGVVTERYGDTLIDSDLRTSLLVLMTATGLVLLIAASVDALSRRRAAASGRA